MVEVYVLHNAELDDDSYDIQLHVQNQKYTR